MNDLFVPIILGTARPGRKSKAVARHVLDEVKQRGIMTDIIDVADYGLTGTGVPAPTAALEAYHEKIEAADAFIIVAPEYNHGYPGELKLLLDTAYAAYVRKPVGFVSVSAGLLGGARMVEQLRLVATALRTVPVAPAVHVSQVGAAFDDEGRFAASSLQDVLDEMLDEIAWYARTLRSGRAAS